MIENDWRIGILYRIFYWVFYRIPIRMGVALYLSKGNKEVIDMPNSLRARLKKCVHKGILKDEDFKRIVILPPYASLDCKETLRTSYEKAYKLGWNESKENKVGHWYKANSEDICYTCSFCGVTNASGAKYNYCPHCGAKMESEE